MFPDSVDPAIPDVAFVPPFSTDVPGADPETRAVLLRERVDRATTPALKATLLYELGRIYALELGREEDANKDYLAAFNTLPTFRAPLYALIGNYERRGSVRNLERLYDAEGRSTEDARLRASALVDRAFLLEDVLDRRHESRALYEEALALDPGCLTASLALERWFRQDADSLRASTVIANRLPEIDDPSMWAVLAFEVARRHEIDGKVDEALALYAEAAKVAPDVWVAVDRWERAARRHGRHASLVEALTLRATRLAERASAAPEGGAKDAAFAETSAAWCEVGLVASSALGDLTRALDAYDEALRASPASVAARYGALVAADAAFDFSRVTTEANALLLLDPPAGERAAIEFRLAEAALANGDREAAREALKRAIEAAPGSVAAAVLLEDLEAELGEHSRRLATLETFAADESRDAQERAETWLEIASLAFEDDGDFERAEAAFRKAIDLAADPLPIWQELYVFAARADRAGSMLAAADAIIARAPSGPLRSVWMYERWRLVRDVLRDDPRGLAVMRDAIEDPETHRWSLAGARYVAAEARKYDLLAAAHVHLAQAVDDSALRLAHRVAAARAFALDAQYDAALGILIPEIERGESHPYLREFAEQLAQAADGSAKNVDEIGREQAALRVRIEELVEKGAQTELAGDAESAAGLYEQAASLDRESTLALEALLRLAVRRGSVELERRALGELSAIETAAGRAGLAVVELAALSLRDGIAQTERIALERTFEVDALRASAAALLLTDAYAPLEARLEALSALRRDASNPAAWERAIASASGAEVAPGLDARDPGALATETDDERAAEALRWIAFAQTAHEDEKARAEFADVPRLRVEGLVRAGSFADAAERLGRTRSEDSAWSREALLAYVAEGAPARAIDGLIALTAKAPRDFAAWDALRVAGRECGRWEHVLRACEVLAEVAGEAYVPMLLEEAGAVAMDHVHDDDLAETLFRRALVREPNRPIAFERLRELLGDRKDDAAVVDLLESTIDVTDDETLLARLFYDLARQHRGAGRLEKALAAVENVLMLDRAHLGALALLVEVCISLERYPAAVDALEALAKSPVPSAEKRVARMAAADLLEGKLSDRARALSMLRAIVDDGVADVNVWRRMGGLARELRRPAEVVEAYREAASLSSGDVQAEVFVEWATYCLSVDEREEGVALARRALDASPTCVDALRFLVEVGVDEMDDVAQRFMSEAHARVEADPANVNALRLAKNAAEISRDRAAEYAALAALVALTQATPEEERAFARFRALRAPQTSASDVALSWSDVAPDAEAFLPALAEAAALFASVEHDSEERMLPEALAEDGASLSRVRGFLAERLAFASKAGVAPWVTVSYDRSWSGLVGLWLAAGRGLSPDDSLIADDDDVLRFADAFGAEERSRLGALLPAEAGSLERIARALHVGATLGASFVLVDLESALEACIGRGVTVENVSDSEDARAVLSFWVRKGAPILRSLGVGT